MTMLSVLQRHFQSRVYTFISYNRIFSGTRPDWLKHVHHIHRQSGATLQLSQIQSTPQLPRCDVEVTDHSMFRLYRTVIRVYRISCHRALHLPKREHQFLACYSHKVVSTPLLILPLSTFRDEMRRHDAMFWEVVEDDGDH